MPRMIILLYYDADDIYAIADADAAAELSCLSASLRFITMSCADLFRHYFSAFSPLKRLLSIRHVIFCRQPFYFTMPSCCR